MTNTRQTEDHALIRELLEALKDLLGDLPSVQGGACRHCGREYDDIVIGECPSDDCPSFYARAAIINSGVARTDSGKNLYSVLLLYPDNANDSGTETYYAFVEALDPIEAVAAARRDAVAAQDGVDMDAEDFVPLLVTPGHHYSESLFNT